MPLLAHLALFVAILVDKWVASNSGATKFSKGDVAILVDKWVASPRTFCNDFNTSEVAILVGKWVASIRVCNYKLTTCVAILADKKVNKFNREMLQIVHFPFLCCQPNSS